MPLKFRINSSIDLAECRKIFKEHEKMDIPDVISLKEQLFGPLPARYGLFWKDKDNFILSRWSYTNRRYGGSGYQQKIEMMGRVESTLDKPEFVIQTKDGAGMRILFSILIFFIVFSLFFGFMTIFSTNKINLRTWAFIEIAPLVFSFAIVFGFLMNMFLCVRFLKHLVNPKDSPFSRVS